MNVLIWIVFFAAAAMATHALGAEAVANVLVGVSLATFVLLFVAGWVARQYITSPTHRY